MESLFNSLFFEIVAAAILFGVVVSGLVETLKSKASWVVGYTTIAASVIFSAGITYMLYAYGIERWALADYILLGVMTWLSSQGFNLAIFSRNVAEVITVSGIDDTIDDGEFFPVGGIAEPDEEADPEGV